MATPHPIDRRSLLGLLATGAISLGSRVGNAKGSAPPADLDLHDLRFEARSLARRATVFVPKNVAKGVKLPVLVLLHGLGETGDQRAGAYAWHERYGLSTSYSRLLHPPVAPISRHKYLRPDRAEEINRLLGSRPFRGLILVCPYTPNVYKAPNRNGAIDSYATWIADVLLPAVRQQTPAHSSAAHTGIDGCSLGGFLSFEVFLRRPDLFATCGGVQSAIGRATAVRYAKGIAEAEKKHGKRKVHIETSRSDPYHDANVALARELKSRGVENELRAPPGPHNQPWLQEVGTLEMLLWHDRHLWPRTAKVKKKSVQRRAGKRRGLAPKKRRAVK